MLTFRTLTRLQPTAEGSEFADHFPSVREVETGHAAEVLLDPVQALELVAAGPISLDVRYLLRPNGEGSQIDARLAVEGNGLFGRVLAKATEAMLARAVLASTWTQAVTPAGTP